MGLRGAYNWILKQSEKPNAAWILFVIAFAESSFFPIPPDVLLLPMCLARRDRALRLAGICTLGSVLGAFLGYAIGALFMATFGQVGLSRPITWLTRSSVSMMNSRNGACG